jgi:V/A-type H+/Na+-transporting ATPase subunit E
VAIEDIVARIESDAASEAAELLAAARADADRTIADAKARAEKRSAMVVAAGRAEAGREAATLLANARLAQRDASLTVRGQAADEALAGLESALVALDDARYAALIARELKTVAIEGATLRLGAADAARLRAALPAALAALGLSIGIDEAPADVEHGVVLAADRVRVQVSPEAIVAARRQELEAEADRLLFGSGE